MVPEENFIESVRNVPKERASNGSLDREVCEIRR